MVRLGDDAADEAQATGSNDLFRARLDQTGGLGVYVKPINYPTVPRGTERLGLHRRRTTADIEHLVRALAEIWAEVGLAKVG